MTKLIETLKIVLRDMVLFAQYASGVVLREYQKAPARRVLDSILNGYGDTIVIIFPRQSGKNELQAQLESYLLMLFSQAMKPSEIVKVSPTFKPQTQNSMRRLERVLTRNLLTSTLWRKASGYIYAIGNALIYFFSAHRGANVVGATASLLLEVDEAQDVDEDKFVKDILPMAASTNATQVYCGTCWTSDTLLAKQRRAAEAAQAVDGRRRVWVLTADDVRKEVPAYGKFVDAQVAKYGRNHPLIRTQYFSEEIDVEGGFFPPERRALLRGTHSRLVAPKPGKAYAVLIDIAGADEKPPELGEDLEMANNRRNLTALTVVEEDSSAMADPLVQGKRYLTVYRQAWRDVKHSLLLPQLRAAIEHWKAGHVVVDATGMGEGIASFLVAAFGSRVLPFIFTGKSKSDMGWGLIGLIETGRLKEYGEPDPLQDELFVQLEYCKHKMGLGQTVQWGVPDGTRNLATGEMVFDDLAMSLALVTQLDGLAGGGPTVSQVITQDPFEGLRSVV